MHTTSETLPLYDIHQAAFLEFKGTPPILTKQGSRVVSRYRRQKQTYALLRGYQDNPSIPLLDYVAVLRRLRARMLEARDGNEKREGEREMDTGTLCSPLNNVLSLLDNPRPIGNRYVTKCPAHNDAEASLSISEGSDGQALIHCFAGCPTKAYNRRLGA